MKPILKNYKINGDKEVGYERLATEVIIQAVTDIMDGIKSVMLVMAKCGPDYAYKRSVSCVTDYKDAWRYLRKPDNDIICEDLRKKICEEAEKEVNRYMHEDLDLTDEESERALLWTRFCVKNKRICTFGCDCDKCYLVAEKLKKKRIKKGRQQP